MIQITSLNELSTEAVQEQKAILTQLLQDKYPNIDLRHGVLHDLVQHINAIYQTKVETEIDKIRNASSLLSLTVDSDSADTDAVDHILSNYKISRKAGSCAVGLLTLEFSEDNALFIPAGTVFNTNGVSFQTEQGFAVYNSGSRHLTLADRVLHKVASGNYGCSIPVTATTVGTAGCVERGAVFTCAAELTNLITAYASDNFTAGTDDETNNELIARLQTGIATPTWGTRTSIEALIRKSGVAPNLVAVSVIGYAEPEMRRDNADILPVSAGGCVDVYVKPAAYYITETVEITAQAVEKTCDSTIWESQLPQGLLPGFWRIVEIQPSSEQSLDSLELQKQTILSTRNDCNAQDVAYTNEQVAEINFASYPIGISSTEIGSLESFRVTAIGVSDITPITNLLNSKEVKPLSCDVLVKAAIPCITSVDIVLQQTQLDPITEDTKNKIKTEITKKINNTGFCETLSTAELAPIITELLSGTQNAISIRLGGLLLLPDGSVRRQTSSEKITIPYLPEKYVSKNTTVFYTGPDSIKIDVKTK